MTRKEKGRYRWHGDATPKTSSSRNRNPICSRVKAAIVRLAVSGVISAGWATWLIQHGGLKDA